MRFSILHPPAPELRISEAWASHRFLALSTVSESEELEERRTKTRLLQTFMALSKSIRPEAHSKNQNKGL